MKNSGRALHESLRSWDERLAKVARPIGILRNLNWDPSHRASFLQNYTRGTAKLPQLDYPQIDYSKSRKELSEIITHLDVLHPAFRFLARTARSFYLTCEMMEARGTERFSELSREIYGCPSEQVHGDAPSYFEGAKVFVEATKDFTNSCSIPESAVCITPGSLRGDLESKWKEQFPALELTFELDDKLLSKAAAGASRVRIRTSTCFSEADVAQLLHHEAFVHSLTSMNGKAQPVLKTMGLGAPRTTRTQEGLALFAELITNSMDLSRLRRVALRVVATQMGLEGADFIQVFEFFLAQGQSNIDAFDSAARIFRGGKTEGGSVFTKDIVYLAGLVDVHTFFRKSIQAGKLEYPQYLFSGRLTLGDVLELEESFASGLVEATKHLPAWSGERSRLAAFLLYSSFLNLIPLNDISLSDFKNPPLARIT